MANQFERVVALDPGGRSGWASARMAPDRFEWTGTGVLRRDLMVEWLADQQNLLDIDGSPGFGRAFDVVVFESWIPREQNGSMEWIKGRPLYEAEDIGAMKWIATKTGARVVVQHPSDKPQAVANMPAALLDLDKDSNEQHDQDARMHLWIYYWRNWFSATVDPAATVLI